MTFNLPPDELDRDLVLGFFWKFSVFECALKREGFLRPGPKNGAEPNWDRFGKEVQGRFSQVSIPGFADAVGNFRKLSPQRQVVRDGHLGWEPIRQKAGQADEEYILRLLRTVRNNLFHGGKYPDGSIAEVARDRDILRAALKILDGCYEIHAGVKRWIDEAAYQQVASNNPTHRR